MQTEVGPALRGRRAEREGRITAAQAADLLAIFAQAASTWAILEIPEEIARRAEDGFPSEPVRTLEAVHPIPAPPRRVVHRKCEPRIKHDRFTKIPTAGPRALYSRPVAGLSVLSSAPQSTILSILPFRRNGMDGSRVAPAAVPSARPSSADSPLSGGRLDDANTVDFDSLSVVAEVGAASAGFAALLGVLRRYGLDRLAASGVAARSLIEVAFSLVPRRVGNLRGLCRRCIQFHRPGDLRPGKGAP